MPKKFKFFKQLNAMDCGPTCLKMISYFYGNKSDSEDFRKLSGFSKSGVTFLGIASAAQRLGFDANGVTISYTDLANNALLPCIAHWDQNHFVVIISMHNTVKVADPKFGILNFNKADFLAKWGKYDKDSESFGNVLLLAPNKTFRQSKLKKNKKNKAWPELFKELEKHKFTTFKVLCTFLLISGFQMLLPFFTQSIVDSGIVYKNINLITVILTGQFILLLSRSLVELVRSYLTQFLSLAVNISVRIKFWEKLLKLKLSFYELHNTNDTIQRLADNRKLQTFITGPLISITFALFNLVVFSISLIYYSLSLFWLIGIASIIYYLWMAFFLKYREKMNHKNFGLNTKEGNLSLELINGMHEIRINSGENSYLKRYLNIMNQISKVTFDGLKINQLDRIGLLFFTQGKDLLIIYISAQLVIQGDLTLGSMLAIQYIIGQLNSPIEQLISFMQSYQDTSISLKRVAEIKDMEEEYCDPTPSTIEPKDISFHNITFSYPGNEDIPVLKNINLKIPVSKVTAIVGLSGSGKTTLLKLLLKIHEPTNGIIWIGEKRLNEIDSKQWWSQCGCVMQDGYIFNDTIANNICLDEEKINEADLDRSCKIANIDFVNTSVSKYETRLGYGGVGLSQGQKQRILIARSIYHNPDFILFDEATNSLDTWNEKTIVENLTYHCKGRTVLIVAHRLSTVKNADKIVVLESGSISETGTHQELIQLKGKYYSLIRNQLELDKS